MPSKDNLKLGYFCAWGAGSSDCDDFFKEIVLVVTSSNSCRTMYLRPSRSQDGSNLTDCRSEVQSSYLPRIKNQQMWVKNETAGVESSAILRVNHCDYDRSRRYLSTGVELFPGKDRATWWTIILKKYLFSEKVLDEKVMFDLTSSR